MYHWVNLTKDNDWNGTYYTLGFKDWLCPMKNQTIKLMGIYTSQEFDFVKISVNRCNNSTIANYFGQGVVCASSDVVAA